MKIKNKVITISLLLSLSVFNHTATYSAEDIVYDQYGWSKEGINKDTGTLFNRYGWDKNGVHKDTHTVFNPKGWTIDNLNRDTGTIYDKRGWTVNGINQSTGTKYDQNGYDIFGVKKRKTAPIKTDWTKGGINKKTGTKYNQYGWSKDGISKDTGTKYNQYGWNRRGINKDTNTKYNKDGWSIDNKNRYTGTKYNKDGFTIDGVSKDTGTKYNSKGYDSFGNREGGITPSTSVFTTVPATAPIAITTAPLSELNFQKDIVIPSSNQLEDNGFKNSRISLSNTSSFITKYSGDNHEGNFSDNNFTESQLEFYTEKGDLGYSIFGGEKREGKFYKNENNLEEKFLGGKIIKYLPGIGFFYGGLKYYDGRSEGYYDDYGRFIHKDQTGKENKIRGEVGGYLEKNPYFLSGYIGGDNSSKSADPVYEDGSYGYLEVGKKISHNGDYIIPSLSIYGENYESYSFYDTTFNLAYQHNYSKGYVIPFIGIGLFRDETYNTGSSDFQENPAGKFRIGVRGNHRFNESFGATYGVFWQSETRDYHGSSGNSDLIWTYISLDYYL